MKVLLKGGPGNGYSYDMPLPLSPDFLLPVPLEPTIDILRPFDGSKPNMRVARYSFGGLAVVDVMGVIQWVIYHHESTSVL